MKLMKRIYKDLSDIQKEKYLSICCYDYIHASIKGNFMTDAPYNDHEWNLSPWIFEFEFHRDTGYLFCALSHRMTNSRAYGWDFNGNELDYKIINEVYKDF